METARLARILLPTLAFATVAHAQAPELALQGEPWIRGHVVFTLLDEESAGEVPWLVFGLGPLPLLAPLATPFGPRYVDEVLFLRPLEPIPADGRLDVAFTVPEAHPATVGETVAVQAFVGGELSSPVAFSMGDAFLTPAGAKVLLGPAPQVGADFGDAIAAGDLNGDGHADLAVGAWFEDFQGVEKAGQVYVAWGPDFVEWTILDPPDPMPWTEFGAALEIADLDGDGACELVVGELVEHNPEDPEDTARLYVYAGGDPFPSVPSIVLESPRPGQEALSFGRVLAVADWNGDGWMDIASSMGNATVDGATRAGVVVVHFGPDFASIQEISNPDPQKDDFFGTGLAAADVNGDGVQDLVEASDRADANGLMNAGKAHLFLGPDLKLHATFENPLMQTAFSGFGRAVSAADLTGDGIGDLPIPDSYDHLFLYPGPDLEYVELPGSPPSLPDDGIASVYPVSSFELGDVNADGFVDVLIGTPNSGLIEDCSSSAGLVRVALGPYFSTQRLVWDAPECYTASGWEFALHDLDGDGLLELALEGRSPDEVGDWYGHVTLFGLDGPP